MTQRGAAGADARQRKMNYNDFLTAMMKLSVKVYPHSKSVDDAFQQLLMDNILPSAARRCPDAVDMFLENEDVRKLFGYYRDALEQIFSFYATADKRTAAAMALPSYGQGGSAGYGGGRSPTRATKSVNSMKGALGYQEFLKLASDFDLSNTVILSTIELGDIFLSSIKAVEPDSTIRKLAFLEFWEALVRCALVAYSKISGSTVIDKIRGLFLYMWRSMNKRHVALRGQRPARARSRDAFAHICFPLSLTAQRSARLYGPAKHFDLCGRPAVGRHALQ